MFTITSSQLKMFSGICQNLVVFFVLAIPLSTNINILMFNILGGILSWKAGVLAEEKLEEII